ncbi:hypothetical protein N1F89_17335 [Aquibium sp. A9E412]|uniref:hypothetical protein n=1 Tax=Aquibium sp. A9E412 TaxID=2976767 RepID=UPI0025AF40B8|nr:hypothetical protein [Aquibium sp. A9E412]MDN2567990.1 hypothetical protein [Aquibium sp. A9E412]
MKLTMRLTLDGLVRALRRRDDRVAAASAPRYRAGNTDPAPVRQRRTGRREDRNDQRRA